VQKSKKRIIIGSVIAAVLAGAGIVAYAEYFGPQVVMQTNPDTINCRQGNVLDGVDRQARFTVLSTCEKAVGIVRDMTGQKQDDGDYQFNLDVRPQYKKLLNSGNDNQVNGRLVIEIIPKDQAISTVTIPKNGDTIEVYGAWVTDNPHGWNEIHPAWQVKVVNSTLPANG
jgi:hypothetical protein